MTALRSFVVRSNVTPDVPVQIMVKRTGTMDDLFGERRRRRLLRRAAHGSAADSERSACTLCRVWLLVAKPTPAGLHTHCCC
jgi:hypothetical protein